MELLSISNGVKANMVGLHVQIHCNYWSAPLFHSIHYGIIKIGISMLYESIFISYMYFIVNLHVPNVSELNFYIFIINITCSVNNKRHARIKRHVLLFEYPKF